MSWLPRAIENLLLLIGSCMLLAAAASAATPNGMAHTGAISMKDIAYAAIGLVTVFIGMWSKRQDRDIAEAKATAALALEHVHQLELMLTAIRAEREAEDRLSAPRR